MRTVLLTGRQTLPNVRGITLFTLEIGNRTEMELRSTLPLSEKSDDKNFLHGGYWVICVGLERNDCTKKRKTRILMRDVLSKGAPSSTYR